MDRIIPASPKGRYRLGAGFALVLALLAGFLSFAPAAFAHHPTVSGDTTCNTDGEGYHVNFTSVSWQPNGTNSGGGANPHVDIFYRTQANGVPTGWTMLPWQPTYLYAVENSFEFSDSFIVTPLTPGEQVQLQARATGTWGNGTAGGQTTDGDWLDFPANCQHPGTPTVTSSVACVAGDGTITITLANNGDANTKPVHFEVTNPKDNSVTTRDVAVGQTDTVTLTGFGDGAVTIPVTADGIHHDQTLTVKCDRPGVPAVSATVACANGNGDVTVTLSNTGGDLPITFVVTDPRTNTPTTKVVAPGQTTTVVLAGFADGPVTIPVTADGAHQDQTVTVKCDRPGQPTVTSTVACANGNGDVTVTLANTGGDLPVTFVVTDPRTGTPTTKTLAPGQTDTVTLAGFADGPVTIPVTADGFAADQHLTVHCDGPGVPNVSSGVVCASGNGDVTVTLANTGGNQPIVFVVTDPRTGTPTTKSVAPGASASVTLTGFADGPVTIPVTADGVALDQTLTVHCDVPGVPAVSVSEICANFDGNVTVTLGNTGGTEPIVFVVTDPRTNAKTTKTVAVGDSASVTLAGFPDGPVTIPVTADGKAMNQSVTVDCDRPGTPSVYHDEACTATGGEVTVSLKNNSAVGTAQPIAFVVTDPRDGQTTALTLAPGESGQITLEGMADGTYVIPVTADGVPQPSVEVTIDCQQPEVTTITEDCENGGQVVAIENKGGSPVDVTVAKNGTSVKDVTVPANGSTKVLVPMTPSETATITVTQGSTVIDSREVTHGCEPATTTTTTPASTTTTTPGSTTTVAPSTDPSTPPTTADAAVLGDTVTKSGSLPVTGSNSAGLGILGLCLAAAGFCLLQASRRRA